MPVIIARSVDADESSVTSCASEFARRRETEQILDYYQSEHAGRTYTGSTQQERDSQTPASARNTMSVGRTSMESVASSSGGVQRRTSQRSAGGADKRRLAIVELDTRQESQLSGSPDLPLLARRGLDGSHLRGLALIAPPDAQKIDYTGFSPVPASAPATGVPPAYRATKSEVSHSGHQRSMSDAQSMKKGPTKTSPRDVGIVGTLGSMRPGSHEQTEQPRPGRARPSTADGDHASSTPRCDGLTAPVFQTPRSRSPSPLPQTGADPAPESLRWTQQLTPSFGQDKDIGHPVAGPVLLDLGSGQPVIGRSPKTKTSGLPDASDQRPSSRLPFKPNPSALSYLHYQPGVHSTAGPLPSPPRNILAPQNAVPPPRPPRILSPPPARELEHTKKAAKADSVLITSLKLPAPASLAGSDISISAVSVSSSGSDDKSHAQDENDATPKRGDPTDKARNGTHIREGAFPPSSIFLTHPSQPPPSQDQNHTLDEMVASIGGSSEQEGVSSSRSLLISTATVPSALRHSPARSDLKREGSWVSLGAESFGGGPDDSPPSSYPSSEDESTRVEMTNVGSDEGLASRRRASLPAPPVEPHPRVDSLLRTPSLLSIQQRSRSQASSPPSVSKKPPSTWPDAMNYQDVLSKKSAADRALAYAAKIRELATEETGLRGWLYLSLNAKKERRMAPPTTAPSTNASPRAFAKQPRHLSRNSMASEVTFPIRQDSYTATDLSPRPILEVSPPTTPVTVLPYPSLAHGVGIRKRSSRTFTIDSGVTSSLSTSSRSIGGGFFASIGRKASVKKDKGGTFLPPVSPAKLISSRHPQHQPQPPPQPRPVKLGAPPTLPGGPRAPARYAQRTQSVLFASPTAAAAVASAPEASAPRAEGQAVSMSPRTSSESTEAFDRQLDNLSDLLPQADRTILAGYLRRAQNQDAMLAIGTYLEEEKQGRLRRD